MTKIFLLNGPPSSGKDTIAKAMLGFSIYKFATPIKENCRRIYGLTQQEWDEIDNDPVKKNEPHPAFYGLSCRQVQINFSELFLKPTHGERVFGELLARKITKDKPATVVVSDSGFRAEAEVLVEQFGADNIVLFNLIRDGYDFTGDSRTYIDLKDLGVKCHPLVNSGTPDQVALKALKIIKEEGML